MGDVITDEMPVVFVTTRQARTIYAMPGILIIEARRRLVPWRGEMFSVTD